MLGCKVFLTYKRKRLTSNGHAHRNGCQSLVSVPKDAPLHGSDLYDELIEKHPSEDETGSSLHVCEERGLCCSRVDKQDSTASPSTQKPNAFEAKKNTEESSEGTSKKDIVGPPLTAYCLGSSSSGNADNLGDNCDDEGTAVSYSRDSATATTGDCVGLNPSLKRKNSFESHDTPSMSKTSSAEIPGLLSNDKPTVLSSESADTTKFKAPLITFIRRCKRKNNVGGDDKTANKRSNISSSEAANEKGCAAGDATDLKPARDAHNTSNTILQIENKILEVDSACDHAISNHDAKNLIVEREQINRQNVPKNVFREDEKVLEQNDQITVDVPEDTSCQEISLTNAMKDSSSSGKDVTAVKNAGKDSMREREESRATLNDGLKATIHRSHPVLDLSLTPTDSSGTLECNAYLESYSQKRSVHAVTETVLGSMDSTSRSHAVISHLNFPPEMSNVTKERLEESSSNHHSRLGREASAFMEEPTANCKESNRASIPLDFMSRSKCLRLFAEGRTQDSFQSAFTQPEVTTCMVPDERKNYRFEIENNPLKRRSPPFLGLSLPTRPKTTRFASNNEFTTFPFLNSFGETRQPFEDDMPAQSSSGRISSLVRPKSMLDGIVSRARALSERDIFQEKLKPYTSVWTEEELDSLWIGVRRYGRDNWNTMIRDPRLRFSPWRVASDLADQWEEEQCKLFQGTFAPQIQHSKAHGISFGVNNYSAITGIWRESTTEETRLSLGDVYTRRGGRNISRRARFKSAQISKNDNLVRGPYLDYQGVGYDDDAFNCFRDKTMPKNSLPSTSGPTTFIPTKGNLPHWLREAVFSPPLGQREPALAPSIASIAHSQMMNVTRPLVEAGHMFGRLSRGKDIQTPGGGRANRSSGTDHAEDVIVIDSDASSEETISDDHGCGRP